MSLPYEKARELATVLLSSLVGFLIAVPLTSDITTVPKPLLLGLASLAGLAVGLRRKKSLSFFYFCLLAIGLLSSIIMSQINSLDN